MTIPFKDGHTRQLPILTTARSDTRRTRGRISTAPGSSPTAPLKQAVISASALSLMYPGDGIDGYPREAFIEDLVTEATSEIRGCLERGATVQIDFTEARLSLKLDPSEGLLDAFVDLNNRVLERLTDQERCASACTPVPAATRIRPTAPISITRELLPDLFGLNVGSFYVQIASEADRQRALRILGRARPVAGGSSSA